MLSADNNNERRIMRFHISERDLLDCLTGKLRVTNIPEGSTMERVYQDTETMQLAFIIRNDSFSPLVSGCPIMNFHLEVYRVIEITEK